MQSPDKSYPPITFTTTLQRHNSDKGSCANLQYHNLHPNFISLRRPDAIRRQTDLDEEYYKRKRRLGTKRRLKRRPLTARQKCLKFLPFSFLFKSCKLCFEREEKCQEMYTSTISPTSTTTSTIDASITAVSGTTTAPAPPAAVVAVANCECLSLPNFSFFLKNIYGVKMQTLLIWIELQFPLFCVSFFCFALKIFFWLFVCL